MWLGFISQGHTGLLDQLCECLHSKGENNRVWITVTRRFRCLHWRLWGLWFWKKKWFAHLGISHLPPTSQILQTGLIPGISALVSSSSSTTLTTSSSSSAYASRASSKQTHGLPYHHSWIYLCCSTCVKASCCSTSPCPCILYWSCQAAAGELAIALQ